MGLLDTKRQARVGGPTRYSCGGQTSEDGSGSSDGNTRKKEHKKLTRA